MFEINGDQIRQREPIGGWDWLREQQLDHTHAEIEALSIVIGADGRMLPPVSSHDKRGVVKTIVRGIIC